MRSRIPECWQALGIKIVRSSPSLPLRPSPAGLGDCKFAGLIELVRRPLGFVLELVAGSAHACSLGIPTLNHEVGDNAVQNRPVIESAFALLSGGGMRPLTLAFGKFGEVGDSLGRIFFEQAACNVSFACFKGGIE